jgi:hypothetical protein
VGNEYVSFCKMKEQSKPRFVYAAQVKHEVLRRIEPSNLVILAALEGLPTNDLWVSGENALQISPQSRATIAHEIVVPWARNQPFDLR